MPQTIDPKPPPIDSKPLPTPCHSRLALYQTHSPGAPPPPAPRPNRTSVDPEPLPNDHSRLRNRRLRATHDSMPLSTGFTPPAAIARTEPQSISSRSRSVFPGFNGYQLVIKYQTHSPGAPPPPPPCDDRDVQIQGLSLSTSQSRLALARLTATASRYCSIRLPRLECRRYFRPATEMSKS